MISLVLAMLLSLAPQDNWETIETTPITIRTRIRDDGIEEIWGQGVIEAPAYDIQTALVDVSSYPRWMPHTVEAQIIKTQPDGIMYVYQRLSFPVIQDRDVVLLGTVQTGIREDSSGGFRSSWSAAIDLLPPKDCCVRLTKNDGSWQVHALSSGRSYASFKTAADPGGDIPPFLRSMGKKQAILDTFKAVGIEARRLWLKRL